MTDGSRPSRETRARRTMARARKPVDWSRLRSQAIAVATRSNTTAPASRFCMNAMKSFKLGDAKRPDRGHLAHQHVNRFGIPLPARSVDQDADRIVDRPGLAVGPVGDQRVVRVANGDDSGEVGDGAARERI